MARRALWRRGLSAVALAAVVLLQALPALAYAAEAGAPDKVPILIIDAGLGDAFYYRTHWLGEEVAVAQDGPVRLTTSAAPVWWGGPGGPDTYLLTSSDASGSIGAAPIDAGRIAWALDQLAERHREGKAVLVAQGATGLQARAYAEDISDPKQSHRADVVGLVMMGVPNRGLSLPNTYGSLDIWAPFASGAGLTPGELAPDSDLVTSLNKGKLPAVIRSLAVQGFCAKLGGQDSDGVTVRGESELPTGVATGPSDVVQVHARASQAWPMRDTWNAATARGGAKVNLVPEAEAERFVGASGYVTAEETRKSLRTFYETWFTQGPPITHISTRLVMDVSGSMAESFGKGSKLQAAKDAARGFVAAYRARSAVSGAVPEDLGLISFTTSAKVVDAPGTSGDVVVKDIGRLKARGNTDVGEALGVAVDSFTDSPRAADKVVVLLSDGVNTDGLDTKAILAGPVKEASASGVKIDTIALGGIKTADLGFLKKIASKTGGTFRQSKDAFELRRDFIRARYSSLGAISLDAEASLPASSTIAVGRVTDGTRLLEIGLVPDRGSPAWRLMRDGRAVPDSQYTMSAADDGVLSLAISQPAAGAYTLKLADASNTGRVHVFAVTQADAFRLKTTAAPQDDTPFLLLVGVGVVGLAAVGGTVALSLRKKGEVTPHDGSDGLYTEQMGATEQDMDNGGD